MEHIIENIVDLDNPIEDKLIDIINYFVKFYGEENRTKIAHSLLNTFIIYADRTNLEKSYRKYFDEVRGDFTDKTIDRIYEETGASMKSGEQLLEYLSWTENWTDKIEREDLGKAGEFFDYFLFRIPKNTSTTVSSANLSQILVDKEYSHYVYDFIKKLNNIYQDVRDDFEKLDFEEEEFIENYKAKEESAIFNKCEDLCKQDIREVILRELDFLEFDLDVVDNLTNNIIDYSRRGILKDIIDYTNDELFQKFFKNNGEEIENIIKDYDSIKEREIISRFESSPVYKNMINSGIYISDEIKKFIRKFYLGNELSTSGANITCYEKKNPKNKMGVCLFSSLIRLTDGVVIHELNHAITNEITNLPSGEFIFKYGFTGNSSILTEVINEYVSQKICKMMYDDNFHISVNRLSESDYQLLFPLFRDFIEENIEDVKKCLLSKDINISGKLFGKNNVDEMEKIADEAFSLFEENANEDNESEIFNSRRPLFNYAKIHGTKELNPLERRYLKCFARMKKVIDNIDEYKKSNRTNKIENEVNIEK